MATCEGRLADCQSAIQQINNLRYDTADLAWSRSTRDACLASVADSAFPAVLLPLVHNSISLGMTLSLKLCFLSAAKQSFKSHLRFQTEFGHEES